MTGMTLKQAARRKYLELCLAFRELKKKGIKTNDDRLAFLSLSIQIHAAKADVPKRLWPQANK
jgi:hypothetical protein